MRITNQCPTYPLSWLIPCCVPGQGVLLLVQRVACRQNKLQWCDGTRLLKLTQGQLPDPLPLAPQSDLLLFEVSPLLLVHKHQVQVVPGHHWVKKCPLRRGRDEMYSPDGKFLVDIPHGGSEVVSREEHANGNALAPHRSTVHDLVSVDMWIYLLLIVCNATHLAMVSFSWKVFGPLPVVSLLIIAISMCLIFMRTRRK